MQARVRAPSTVHAYSFKMRTFDWDFFFILKHFYRHRLCELISSWEAHDVFRPKLIHLLSKKRNFNRWRTKQQGSRMSQHAQPLRHQTEGLITKRGEPHVRQIWMLLQSTADDVWVKWPFKASAAYSEEASLQSSWRSNSSTSRHFSAGHWRAQGAGITHQSLRHRWWRRPPRPQICDWKYGTTKDWLTCLPSQNTNAWFIRTERRSAVVPTSFTHTHTHSVCVKDTLNKLSHAHTSPPFGAS